MAGGPVQLIMDPERFRENRPKRQVGGGKDFFQGDDAGFVAHRDALVVELDQILSKHLPDTELILVQVRMRPDGLAKSHRPLSATFSASRASHVGTELYGEMIFATSFSNLQAIASRIAGGENVVRIRDDAAGEPKPAPSATRCETSAIAEIREWNAPSNREFALDELDDWLSSARGGHKLILEAFDLPSREPMRSAMARELAVLGRTLGNGQSRVRLSLPPGWGSNVLSLSIGGGYAWVQSSGDLESEGELDVQGGVRQILLEAESSLVVRKVALQDQIDDIDSAPQESGEPIALEGPSQGGVVGVLDGGVSRSVPCVARLEYIAQEHTSTATVDHGTKVGGLIALGQALNGQFLAERDCRIVDIRLFPDPAFGDVYYSDMSDFFLQLASDVRRARDEFGVRVFNLSWNLRRPLGARNYSKAAQELDRLTIELDVIFVISAGNLSRAEERQEWPPSANDALGVLAAGTNDGTLAPSESVANLAIGALNPPDLAVQIEGAPARYTRRGRRIPSAVKPDLAHYGGAGTDSSRDSSGMVSVGYTGNPVDVQGTSFAAPLVAKYLANLDSAISGSVPREVLLGLAIHFAEIPPILRRQKRVSELAPSLVGYGMPMTALETLDGAASEMTFVLADVLLPGKRVDFSFPWPPSLVNSNSSCRGDVALTLVAKPILNAAHGQEQVRVNVEAALKQADQSGKFTSKTSATHTFFSGLTQVNEKTLAMELGKWFPIKSYSGRMPKGVGKSSDWRLEIDYLTRAGELLPESGIEFAAILTIRDIDRQAPVFAEMRAGLARQGIRAQDLRTAINIGVRN